jgi:cobalamin-dependent methionine synthase I
MKRPFIAIGENIHCTRIFKVGGKFCRAQADGTFAIRYASAEGVQWLPVPAVFTENADWAADKVKHCAVAIWQGNYADDEAVRTAGRDYIMAHARAQEQADASYLDVNVDEFSTDIEERVRLMTWTVGVIQDAVSIPVSVDSSNTTILDAGLAAADPARGRPLVNSASLDRVEALDVARRHNAVLVVSAAGEAGLPNEVDERMVNIRRIVALAQAQAFELGDLFVDPLVFPIATDGLNGKRFLDTVAAIRAEFGEAIHITAGLSNVSFGMPNRKLINQVFARLACDMGADSGIVDPAQINGNILDAMDPEAEDFKLARELLLGNDEYGMSYITAMRDAR